MKRSLIRFGVVPLTSVFVLLLVTSGAALDFEITKVVEVGPAAWVPFTGPLRWSPDGAHLAYFANNYLMISDTLGNSHEVIPIEKGIRVQRFEWATNDKIAINMQQRRPEDSVLHNGIGLIDINDCSHNLIVSEAPNAMRSSLDGAGEIYIEGPFLSLEGNAYYLTKTCTGGWISWARGKRAETVDEAHWIVPFKAPEMANNHIVRRSREGLYLVALDQSDSTRLADDPDSLQYGVLINRDLSFVLSLNDLVRLSDSQRIHPLHYSGAKPGGTFGCGLLFASFNPMASELIFNQTCDGDRPDRSEFVIDRVGIFDYSELTYVVLDTLLGLSNCTAPTFSPDGRRIALLCDGEVYIVERGNR